MFFLTPGQSYDVRLALEDPDNPGPVTKDLSITKRANEPVPSGAALWVDVQKGSDSAAGSEGSPLATISAAAAKAAAGQMVHVKAGVYRVSITPPVAGTTDRRSGDQRLGSDGRTSPARSRRSHRRH